MSLSSKLLELAGLAIYDINRVFRGLICNFSKSVGSLKKVRDRNKTLCYAQGL